MVDDRLPTELWVSAQLRRFADSGAYLLKRGDAERGAIVVRLAGKSGTRILIQARDLNGKLMWMGARDGAALTEEEANAYIDRAVARDSDLWVIEIETKADENPFQGEVIGF
jgi:hypothetical protein